MVGTNLLRFDGERQYLILDVEAESLNLATARPWELAYAVATLKEGIQFVSAKYLLWPDLNISVDAARIAHFDRDKYLATAQSPKPILDQFSALLYDPSYTIIGHGLLGYDVYILKNLFHAVGVPFNDPFIDRILDTNSLSKAYKKGWKVPAAGLDRVAFMYKARNYVEKGLKSSLGLMCKEFSIPFDEQSAHSAAYDIRQNWELFRALLFKLEI